MLLRSRIIGTWTLVFIVFCASAYAQDSLRVPYPRTNLALLTQQDSAVALRKLQAKLDGVFNSRTYRGSQAGAVVVLVKSGKPVYAYNPTAALTPASNTKIVSTAAVFNILGKGGTVNTDIRVDGPIDVTGTLRGNLYIVGKGDALLSPTDLELIADKIRALGVKRITGNVYGDATFFDDVTDRAVYSGDGEHVQPLPPITPLTMNKSTVAVIVNGASNGRITAQTIPTSDALQIAIGSVPTPKSSITPRKKNSNTKRKTTVKKRTTKQSTKPVSKKKKKKHASIPSMQIERYGDAPPFPPEPQRKRRKKGSIRRARVAVSSSLSQNGIQIISVSGSPGANRSYTTYITMKKPAMVCAGALMVRMRSAGIYIEGEVGEKKAPAGAKQIESFRRPFVDFASIVNKRSDNYLAEHVFKMLGGLGGASVNTAAAAKRLMSGVFDTLGVPRMNCSFNDGSGLSRRNKVSAAALAGLLLSITKEPWYSEFDQSLAIAGYDGTIRGRMKGTLAENNVHAKTGTLRNTSALAGYVYSKDGDLMAFAFISNGPNVRSFKGLENQAAIILANFTFGAVNEDLIETAIEADSTYNVEEDLSEEP